MEADQSPVVTSTTGIPSWPSVSSCQKDLFQPEEGNLNHVNHPHCIEDIEASAGIPNLTLYNHLEQVNHLYIKVVPQYWLEREPPSKMVQALVNVYFVLAAVPANISHILVILAFIRSRNLRSASNRLLMSLMVADLILLSNCYLVVFQNVFNSPSVSVCQWYGFSGTVAALAEIWSLALVSVDRMHAVLNPLDKCKRIKARQANVMITFIWFLSLLFGVFPLLGWNSYVSEVFLVGCSFNSFSLGWSDLSYILVLLVLAWLIPMLVICFCYLTIVVSARKNMKSMMSFSSFSDQNERRVIKTQLTLGKMVCGLILVWFLAWTPYAVLSSWIMFFDARGLTPALALLPTICCKLSASTNALLYGSRLPKFKAEIKKMLLGVNSQVNANQMSSNDQANLTMFRKEFMRRQCSQNEFKEVMEMEVAVG